MKHVQKGTILYIGPEQGIYPLSPTLSTVVLKDWVARMESQMKFKCWHA